MKRLAAFVLAWCCACAGAQVTVQDERGLQVRLPSPPQRIVSLLPSLTETVCALGACARLVGTDRHSNHPLAVRALPKVGGLDDTHVEAIAALRPDLVLVAGASRTSERLEALGLTVLALEPRDLASTRRVIDTLARALGLPASEGAALWQRIDAQMAAAVRSLQSLPPSARGPSVYYEIDASPYAAGAASFIGEMLARMGARNIVPASLGAFPKLNPEFVVRADPQLILIGEGSADGLADRPGWGRIRALREGRVCRFSAEQSDVMVRPGPRMGEGAEVMAACLRRFAAAPAARPEAP